MMTLKIQPKLNDDIKYSFLHMNGCAEIAIFSLEKLML